MNARFYVPAVGRFASADSLVPDPNNPQSYNRYSYVLNAPLNFTDPTGRCEQEGDEGCWALAQEISNAYSLDLAFLGTLTISQMRFFVEGLDQAAGVDSGIPASIIAAINQMGEFFPDWLTYLNDEIGWDVIGFRLELAYAPLVAGGQIDFDILFNFESWEVSLFASPGVQVGLLQGGNVGLGVLLGFNFPSNSTFQSFGWGATAAVAITGGVAVQYNDYVGDAWSLALGVEAGEEIDISLGVSYSLEVFRWSGTPRQGDSDYWDILPQWNYWRGLLLGCEGSLSCILGGF
ncbi:MAG: RHS repeat-associated core domain-containing protein [Candidatus Promineifilaceae bacterium]